MLIEFAVSNWACFKSEVSLSMLASGERKHKEHLAVLPKCRDVKVLPVAATFGANASGKSKLIEAMAFAKAFITNAAGMNDLIPVRPFMFDKDSLRAPSTFSFTILVEETLFQYAFSVLADRVVSEQLAEVLPKRNKVLFRRGPASDAGTGLPAADDFFLAPGIAEEQRLRMAFQGTRANQLFLNNAIYQKIGVFLPVFNWFRDQLEIIEPGSSFIPVEQFVSHNSPLGPHIAKALSDLDTGIVGIEFREEPFSTAALHPAEVQNLENNLKEGMLVRFRQGKELLILSREGGELKMRRIVSVHRAADGREVHLAMSAESDGTLRLLDLLPAFFTLGDATAKKVYVIDELDRSLHPSLMEYLIRLFLQSAGAGTRSQILFTTHNVQVLTQDIFRRDEMWLVRRDSEGVSELVSLGDFKDIRFDKDIRKSYLEGRLGGIPHISPSMALQPEPEIQVAERTEPYVAEP
ncbi:MAG: ATP-binding protein [Kiritimatiellae bacterium]|nr:ATP-binding protein [Kiritimatiellia bacterium]